MEQLVKKAKNRNKEAFEDLMQIQAQSMYKVAKAILKNDEDVLDAMQETALTCWEKSIGEVELVINWLAGHGVPVVFVSGDNAVKKELDGYDCEFYASNEAGKEAFARQALLEKTRPHIKKALELPRERKTHYDISQIKIKLIGESYYKWLPHELFSTDNGMVVFRDTKSFISSILYFCRFLNIAEEYQRLRMRCLVQNIKKCSVCIENDRRGKELLNQKDWRALSDKEISYLYSLLQ